jgi:protein-S-isoprenylcysteine O-methyltransferase Ste14
MRHVVSDAVSAGVLACWGLLGIVWVLGAWRGERRGARDSGEPRDVGSLAASVGAICVLESPASVWSAVTIGSVWARAAGLPPLLAATVATIAARRSLGDSWSSAPRARERRLRTDGAYAFARHPIYAGVLAMLLATALAYGLGRWLALTAVVALALAFKIRSEESLLATAFPEQHRRYRERVPCLVPRVVGRRR